MTNETPDLQVEQVRRDEDGHAIRPGWSVESHRQAVDEYRHDRSMGHYAEDGGR